MFVCPLMEGTLPDIGDYQYLCQRCVRNTAVVRCLHCDRMICEECGLNDYDAGAVVCSEPCIFRGPGSSNSEPATDRRAISQLFCGRSYGRLRARRNGSERVQREVTIIREHLWIILRGSVHIQDRTMTQDPLRKIYKTIWTRVHSERSSSKSPLSQVWGATSINR